MPCIFFLDANTELAGFAAALINEYTHITTDSAGALWQIRNSILYPQHTHAKPLEAIVHHIQLSKEPSISTSLMLMLAS